VFPAYSREVVQILLLAFSFLRLAPDEPLSGTQPVDWSFYEPH
jgi:hypothetical protein